MALSINGIFIKNLPVQHGQGKNGPWSRGGFVIQTGDEYTRLVAFTLFGEERISLASAFPQGTPVTVFFTPESREYQDRYITELRCYNIQPLTIRQPDSAN